MNFKDSQAKIKRRNKSIQRINRIFLTITLVIWCWAVGSASAAECPDLVVDEEVVVDGGCYGIIFVKNDGKLTINGDTTAQSVLIQWGQCIVNGNLDVADYITVQANPIGTMTVNGDISANRISIEGGTLTINGTQKQPMESVIVESGELHLCGNWFVSDMRINGGVVYVIPYSDSLEGSGRFFLECDQVAIEAGGSINADDTGGDTRGIGVDGGYGGAGGGGYGGKGGNGTAGAGGNTYGGNFSPTIEMGSRGGNFGKNQGGKGGGNISIISTGDIAIYGTVTANGGNGPGYSSGGGSGGGILIYSTNLDFIGSITTNGGNGGMDDGGGGGGGRIKLFYKTGISTDDLVSKLSVNSSQGGRHVQPGQNGTIWTDAIPNPPELIAPEDRALLITDRLFVSTLLRPV